MSKIIAVIWDYDGTLVDTRYKNLNVNRKIIQELSGKNSDDFPALRSINNYQVILDKIVNWQELYQKHFGLSEEQVLSAGKLWSIYQNSDETATPLYFGLLEVFEKLKDYPQGIFSQNSRDQILKTITQEGVASYFKTVTGYEELNKDDQKPSPAGLLKTLHLLTTKTEGIVLFVGDHSTDFKCAINANNHFMKHGQDITVISLGVNYNAESSPENWEVKPDYILKKPGDILVVIKKFRGESI